MNVVPAGVRAALLPAWGEDGRRWVWKPEQGRPGQSAQDTCVGAVWSCSIDRRLRESRIEEMPLNELLRALLEAMSCFYPVYPGTGRDVRGFQTLLSLANDTLAFRVRLGRDLLDRPSDVIQRLYDLSARAK